MQKDNLEKIAKERIEILFEKAEQALKNNNPGLSKRYVALARQIGMKLELPIPRNLKRKFCKKCSIFWIPGKTLRTRIKKHEKRMTFTCLECGNIQRYPYIKEKKNI